MRVWLPIDARWLPVILAALAAAFYFVKPAELRRDPLTELSGFVGAARTYEVSYTRCTDGSDTVTTDVAGFARGFVGAYKIAFYAKDDVEAVALAVQARPQCRVNTLWQKNRWYFPFRPGGRYRDVAIPRA